MAITRPSRLREKAEKIVKSCFSCAGHLICALRCEGTREKLTRLIGSRAPPMGEHSLREDRENLRIVDADGDEGQ